MKTNKQKVGFTQLEGGREVKERGGKKLKGP
jgi:hypothetical protein